MCSHTRGANYSSCELRPCDAAAADAAAALTWFFRTEDVPVVEWFAFCRQNIACALPVAHSENV